jgi:hypothetical protein
MTIDDLLRKVAAQQPVSETRLVRIHGPELLQVLSSGQPLTIAEIESHPDQHQESRTFRYGHLVGPGLEPRRIAAWQAAWPEHQLPADLSQLLTRANGIHLWADLDVGRAYYGLLPLAEWEDAAHTEWSGMFATPPVGCLVVSYHDNGDNLLVLDTLSGGYRWYDLEDFDHPIVVARSVPQLLTWLWNIAQELDPRADAG